MNYESAVKLIYSCQELVYNQSGRALTHFERLLVHGLLEGKRKCSVKVLSYCDKSV